MKRLVISDDPQPVSADIMESYFPERIEIYKGVIGWDKETQERMFRVLAFNIGLKRIKEIWDENEKEKKHLSELNSIRDTAEEQAIIKKVYSLLASGMKLDDIVTHTPYTQSELERILKSSNL